MLESFLVNNPPFYVDIPRSNSDQDSHSQYLGKYYVNGECFKLTFTNLLESPF